MHAAGLRSLFLAAALAVGSAGPALAVAPAAESAQKNETPDPEVMAMAAAPGANLSATHDLMSMAKDDSVEDNPKLQEEYAAKARILLSKGADASYNNGEALMYAAKNGQLPLVKVLVEEGKVDLNIRNGQALLLSAMRGRDEVVSYLIDKGMDPNGAEKIGRPLAHAAGNEYVSTVELLVKRGADINIKEGYPLGIASNLGALKGVEKLLELKADINAGQGLALRSAAEGGNTEVVKLLLEKGADPTLRGVSAAVAELAAGAFGKAKPEYKEIAELLQKAREGKEIAADAPLPQPAASEPVTEAPKAAVVAQNKESSVDPKNEKRGVEKYEGTLQYNDETGWNLAEAASRGNLDRMRALIEKGAADPNFENGLPLFNAAERGQIEAIQLLLDSGADISINNGGALISAADVGNKDVVKFLIDHGIDVFSSDAELYLEHMQMAKADPEFATKKYSQPVYSEMVDMINAARKVKKPDYLPKVFPIIPLGDGMYKSTVQPSPSP